MAELHPELEELLRDREAENIAPANSLSPEAARRQHRELATTEGGPAMASVRNISIDGPADDIPLRIYRPGGEGPFPVLLWIHGGGFVVGDLDTADPVCRTLAETAECMVVSVDYRLAPEHPFPAAPKDCYAALQWTAEHVDTFDGDPDRIAVGGDSAGGNLAAVTALQARDRDGPELTYQVLVYPVTTTGEALPARQENAEGYGLTTAEMDWFDDQYVPDEFDRAHPYAYPLRARDLTDLPPATVLTAEFDPLRDDGIHYANRLESADVPTIHRNYEDAIHGFFGMLADPALDRAHEAIEDACTDLRAAYE